jgi:hypothetical protein
VLFALRPTYPHFPKFLRPLQQAPLPANLFIVVGRPARQLSIAFEASSFARGLIVRGARLRRLSPDGEPELDQAAHGLWSIDCRTMLFSDPFVDLLELRAAEDGFKHFLKLLLQN